MTTLRTVALIGFPGAQSLDLVGPLEVFASANAHRASPAYRVILASPEGGEIRSGSGLTMTGFTRIADLPDDLDTVVIAGGSSEGLTQAISGTRLVPWIQARAPQTRRMASVCTGAFVLAAAGLLDGRRATTHWNSCAELAAFRPAVTLEPDAIYVAAPPVYTSAGVTAGIDLTLALVEEDLGPQIALSIARHLVLFLRRPGGQAQFSTGLQLQAAATPRLRSLIAEIVADPSGDLSVPALADRAGMSERTFCRAFRKETGATPAAFVETARLDRAKSLLESSDWPLARIADRAGFGSLDALHRAFAKALRITPGDYRERFGRGR